MKPKISRRRLVAGAAGFGAGVLILPGLNTLAYAANDRLNLALVGCGNRGGDLLDSFLRIGENVVALCDVNQQRAARTFQKAPDIPKHLDYRKMLEENSRHIDAVIVATTDHHHAPCSALAMKLGKPVYCEKPLTLTVHEARDIRRIAGKRAWPRRWATRVRPPMRSASRSSCFRLAAWAMYATHTFGVA